MTKIQKNHLVYALISICAICAYGGFLVRNAIKDVDTTEETLPYDYQEEFLPEIITEPEIDVQEVIIFEKTVELPTQEIEEPTEVVTEPKFSPILPVEGTIVKDFSEKHVYNQSTNDWRSHMGLDISANAAENVKACEDGAVTAVYTDPRWGNVIEIDHGEYISVYKNVSTLIMVKEGDSVKKGDTISGVGEGITTEGYKHPYIHFEMLYYGEYVNPSSLID